MQTQICKQCGELRPIEQFRKYYGNRKGYYKTCKSCEKINSREKYLRQKGDELNYEEEAELDKIHRLYELQREAGLQPPRADAGRSVPITESLDSMISKYENHAKANVVVVSSGSRNIPAELYMWLTTELTEEPEYYQEEVYDELKTKYRPQVRIDTATMLPVYDDTYKDILDAISDRFDEYEDNYYND